MIAFAKTPVGHKGSCLHCRRYGLIRPRGLCWWCYNDHAVRQGYPTDVSKAGGGFRGHCHGNLLGLPLPAPTACLPGTTGKVAELARRAEAGEALYHPEDAKDGGDLDVPVRCLASSGVLGACREVRSSLAKVHGGYNDTGICR